MLRGRRIPMRLAALLALIACNPDATSDDDPPQQEIYTGFPDGCDLLGFVSASDEEAGYWLSSRITPPTYPFRVDEVGYTIATYGVSPDGICGVVSHRVRIYAGTAIQGDPDYDGEVEMSVGDVDAGGETAPHVVISLAEPLVLQDGEDLFLMLEAAVGRNDRRMCYVGCREPGADDRNHWSDAAEPPFAWQTLASTGLDWELATSIRGFTLTE
jgi:hypothetical protein